MLPEVQGATPSNLWVSKVKPREASQSPRHIVTVEREAKRLTANRETDVDCLLIRRLRNKSKQGIENHLWTI